MLFYSLRFRSEFQAVYRSSSYHHGAYMTLQGLLSPPGNVLPDSLGVGLVVSRKVGNAVKRTFVKRRLRFLFRQAHLEIHKGQSAHLVVIAKKTAYAAPFQDLLRDFKTLCARYQWLEYKEL